MKNNKLRGFTLIELIVVIAIIGILAAFLVPNMLGYVRDSRVARCNANAKSIYSGAQLAITDYVKIGEYVSTDEVFICQAEGDGVCVSVSSNEEKIDITDYIGGEFKGYFGFITNIEGSGCSYAMWSENPVNETMLRTQMTLEDVENTVNSDMRGCYPLKPT